METASRISSEPRQYDSREAPCSILTFPGSKPHANISLWCPLPPLRSRRGPKPGNDFHRWRLYPISGCSWVCLARKDTGIHHQGLTQGQAAHIRTRDSKLHLPPLYLGQHLRARLSRRKLREKGPGQTHPENQSMPETKEDPGWELTATSFWGAWPGRPSVAFTSSILVSSRNRATP